MKKVSFPAKCGISLALLLALGFAGWKYQCCSAHLSPQSPPVYNYLVPSGPVLPKPLAAEPKLTAAPVPQASASEVGYNFTVLWNKFPGAVAYEVRFFHKDEQILEDKRVYINGYNFCLPSNYRYKNISWQVRALNFDREPISAFSKPRTLKLNKKLTTRPVPLPTNKFNQSRGANLLYPVYNWIPVQGIRNYEIEVLKALPKDNLHAADQDILLGKGYSTGFDWYDEEARISDSVMYWRVRGVDTNGMPLTDFSVPEPFQLSTRQSFSIATYGDSITHGGGSVSYSPSDWEYSYQSYLDFETVNLGQSGDTSASTLERFDKDVLPFHPKYLLIMTGSNSLRGWTSAEEVIADLEAIRTKCLKHGIQPIFLTLPPINPDNIQKTFHEPSAPDWVEQFAKANNYIRQHPHIELYTKFTEGQSLPTKLALDGLHLDTPGKKLMAQAINEQLPRLIRQK